MPLDIVFEDDDLLVVAKPAGLVVHPGAGNASGTLLNGLLHYLPGLETLPRAGIIQLETEGVRSHWVPYVRVADPEAIAEQVEELGGRVLIPPSVDLRSGSVALIADPGGAPLVVQQWPIPGQEGGR